MIYCNIKKKLKFVFVHLYIVLFQLYTVSSRLLLLEITGASRLQYMYVHTCVSTFLYSFYSSSSLFILVHHFVIRRMFLYLNLLPDDAKRG